MPHKDREKRREYMAQYGKKYKAQNSERIKAENKRYYEVIKEMKLARQRAYRQANKEKLAEQNSVYYEFHKETRRKYFYRYRQVNKERIDHVSKLWRAANPLNIRDRNHRRRARIRNAFAEKINLEKIIERDRSMCGICGKKVRRDDMHFDHIVPLSCGGNHTMDNLQVAHRKCNLRRFNGVLPAQMRLPLCLP